MNRSRIAAILVFACCLVVTFYAVSANNSERSGQEAAQADVANAIRALGSQNAVERATAACSLRELGARAAPAIPYLIRMLSDDTPVGVIRCGKNGSWGGGDEKNSPGREAAIGSR